MALVTTHQVQGTLRLTIDRPGVRNALNADVVSELRMRLTEAADNDGVRVLVLTGAGTVFSAGADLKALQGLQHATPMENAADSRHLAALFEQIYLHPKPIIAEVNGHAIAGGCGLAAVCDYAYAREGAKLGFTEVRIGFVPAIVSVFIVRKLGEAAARDLLLTGHLITAEEAAANGLITGVAPEADLRRVVMDKAREIASTTSGSAVALTKQLLAAVQGTGLREGLDQAILMNAFARGTADCQAGIEAFLNKQAPPWLLAAKEAGEAS